jgi:hypothetical protein
MRTILNGKTTPITTQVPGRVPLILGATETRFPPKSITIPSLELTTLPDADAAAVLEKHSYEGVIEVLPGMTPEDALAEVKARRMEFLVRFINAFREQNAIQQASGSEIKMPRKIHRDALKEVKALRAEVADDELMTAPLPSVSERVEDVVGQELRAFGIDPKSAPLVPRVQEKGLTDIDF